MPITIVDGIKFHPAVRAWQRFQRGAKSPSTITMLKRPKRAGEGGVFSLHGLGPEGSNVIAKNCLHADGAVERLVYEELLPFVSVAFPVFYGWCFDEFDSGIWIFVEEVSGNRFDESDRSQRSIAAQWIGTLHAQTLEGKPAIGLPVRHSEDYGDWCEQAASNLQQYRSNPALSDLDRDVLVRIMERLETVLGRWDQIEAAYSNMPVAVAHGDFKANNMVFSGGPKPRLVVFDWAEAHLGPTATDLSYIDVQEYHETLQRVGVTVTLDDVERSHQLGLILRTILAIRWESTRLSYEHEHLMRPMRNMAMYDHQLRLVLSGPNWIGR